MTKKMFIYCLVLTLFSFSGWWFVGRIYGHKPETREDILLVQKITHTHEVHMYARHGFHLTMTGGSMMDYVRNIALSYDRKGDMEDEEAIILFQEVYEDLQTLLNEDKELRPYLIEYPLGLDNISLSLTFQGEGEESLYLFVKNKTLHLDRCDQEGKPSMKKQVKLDWDKDLKTRWST